MKLTLSKIKEVLYSKKISAIDFSEIEKIIKNSSIISKYRPDGIYHKDPRTNDLVLFSSARSKRPHDNENKEKTKKATSADEECIICQGRTTPIIDLTKLSKGYTFINFNLFPMLYPEYIPDNKSNDKKSYGLHMLQWTSSIHKNDWHNMPTKDLLKVFERICELEKKLLTESPKHYTSNNEWGGPANHHGYVTYIKNYGRLVGGSLQHGHQQIGLSNIMPENYRRNLEFYKRQGKTFSEYMIERNQKKLLIKKYKQAILIVPYFMKRPYNMMLLVKDTSKNFLYELTKSERKSIVQGWHDAMRLILDIMPNIGREPAFNITSYTGPGAGIYFEFLPYTQETGGFEQLGLWVCQANPEEIAKTLRIRLAKLKEPK